VAEHTVEVLLGLAVRKSMHVGVVTSIVDAGVAIPRRVPREVGRRQLTRIKRLGTGSFGEIHLYQLKERDKGIPTFTVAAKSVKMDDPESAPSSGGPDARRVLLREAALGALLDHRNVVATLGVCTVPRDVPALLLLAFCPEGTLEALANAATPASMTVAERLTHIAQTLQGLQYIAARRIVHRDVAARNVLLDATMICKVSDLGMATVLHDASKEYIRANEQLALRWSPPEVIEEGKYSVQSDVWSFGVLAYEVFACGTVPYADQFDNLTEVSAFVKEGGKLGRPNDAACPAKVYEQLMLPCFDPSPTKRPTFGALYEVAVKHGAEEDDDALEARARHRRGSARRRQVIAKHATAGELLLLRGPSVHHLDTNVVPAVVRAINTIKRSVGHEHQAAFDALAAASKASIWHAVHAYAKAASRDTICPRDGGMSCAYVDTLTAHDDVGPANALLSYSWGYLVAEVSAALSAWAARTERDPKRTCIWICSLCLNQFRMGDDSVVKDLQKEFGDRVVAIGRVLPMLEPWDDPGYVKRAWCLFELYTAIQRPDEVEIDVILSPAQAQAFRDRINADGSDARAIDGALSGIKSEEATASMPADLDMIRALISKHSGGFGTLNDAVKLFLRRWFEAHGGMKVAARRNRAPALPVGRADAALPPPRRVERVPVARFAASASPASRGGGGGGGGAKTGTSAASASTVTATTTTATTAGGSGDPSVSMYVRNPVYDAQGACEDTRGPDITIPGPPTTGSCAPIAVGVAGRSWLDGRRSSSETARLLRPTAGDTHEDVLPVASAGAPSDVGSGSILGRSHRRDETTDGGYMDVEATLPGRQESDVSLITNAGLGRQESDVSLITDAGLGRQESDVSLITDVGIAPSRLSSMSEL
jgi:serine/threonine protein kinase